MTEIQTSELDKRLLLGWQGAPSPERSAGLCRSGTEDGDRTSPNHRPGYTMFKALLVGGMLLLLWSLVPWQQAFAAPQGDASSRIHGGLTIDATAHGRARTT